MTLRIHFRFLYSRRSSGSRHRLCAASILVSLAGYVNTDVVTDLRRIFLRHLVYCVDEMRVIYVDDAEVFPRTVLARCNKIRGKQATDVRV